MIEAVFFDLDGTLLPMDTMEFLRLYLGALEAHFGRLDIERDPRETIKHVNASVYDAIKNEDASVSNGEAFWTAFKGRVGDDFDALYNAVAGFYEGPFDAVGANVSPNSHVKATIASLKARGKRLALATNPLFPLIAVKSRIAWAGLNPSDFEIITDFDSMHRTKPHIEYYMEIADVMGVACENCAMVGNDVTEDILPALKLGMRAFFLDEYGINNAPLPDNVPRGGYSALHNWALTL